MRSGCCVATAGRRVRGSAGGRKRARVDIRGSDDAAVLAALRQVWVIMDCICGKRLAAVLPEMITVLERHGELELAPATRQKLCAISAASIDRLLAAERRRLTIARLLTPKVNLLCLERRKWDMV